MNHLDDRNSTVLDDYVLHRPITSVVNKDLTIKAKDLTIKAKDLTIKAKDLTIKAKAKDLTLKAKAKDLSLDLKDKFEDCSLLLQLQWCRQDLMLGAQKLRKNNF